MKTLVSVIIPAHNEEAYLGKTLEALARQTYPYREVIVVCNDCSDRTGEIAQDGANRVITLQKRGLSRARNIGGNKARGEILVFLDADTLLDPTALEQIVTWFSDGKFASGTLEGVPDSKKLFYRGLYFLKNSVHRAELHQGSAGVIISTREAFKGVRGFDEKLHLRENSDFIRRTRRYGKYKFLSGCRATTSMRRYDKRGALGTTFMWFRIWLRSLYSDLRDKAYEVVR